MAVETLKAEQKALKKFLVQRTILDSFRLYLDMSVKFIRTLEESKLLTKDELYLIKGLQWPSNRNEFLKILVKRPWTKGEFKKFAKILKETQHAKLSEEISQKSEEFIKAALSKSNDTSVAMVTYGTGMNHLSTGALASLPLATRTQVLGLLRDRDEKIYQQTRDIEKLQARIAALTVEVDTTRRQLYTLDKEVTSTLHVIGVESDKGHSSCEQGMIELRERFLRQTNTIQSLKTELDQLKAERIHMKEKLRVVIEESIRSKKINADWAQSYNGLKTSNDEQIKSLKNRVSSQSEMLEELRRKHGELIAVNISSTKAYEQELADLRQKLHASETTMLRAVQTRDHAVSELAKMKDDTRKLLKDLKLDKGVKGTTLNHARNLVHVQKRQAQIAAKLGPTVSPVSEKDSNHDPNQLPILDPPGTSSKGFLSSRTAPKPFPHSKALKSPASSRQNGQVSIPTPSTSKPSTPNYRYSKHQRS